MSIPNIHSHFRILVCFLLFIVYLSFPSSSLAGSEFSTEFNSDYQISLDGITQVTHEISITNLLSHIYTTEYTVLVSSPNIQDVVVSQDDQTIDSITQSNDRTTTITLKNLIPVIGQGQTSTLKISYTTSDIAEILGKTRSINIPRLTKANEASKYSRTIRVPASLGAPSAQYPESSSITTDEGTQESILTYHGHPGKSLTILFGQSEYYQLDLIYQITNPTLSPGPTEIALPPDTPYQTVILNSITPAPTRVHRDLDGNWLASYNLDPNQTLEIDASLYLEVFPLPQSNSTLTNAKALTKEQEFWEAKDSVITELADKLGTPENIYNYLTTNLTYDYSRLSTPSRLGASAALTNQSSALCTEYTDSFITLTRALNIPAREVQGYAYTGSGNLRPLGVATADVLHTWPEYYSEKDSTWVQVDPTWGHTTGGIDYFHKLDFNHLAFAIHGQESSYPLPAGAYKKDPALSTITVTLTNELPEKIENLVETQQDGETIIKNLGNTSIVDPVHGYLPPYGELLIADSAFVSPDLVPNLYPWLLLTLIIVIVFTLIHRKKKSTSR
jgi:hypothetical protein